MPTGYTEAWTNNWTNLKRSWAVGMFSADIGPVYNTSATILNTAVANLDIQRGSMATPLAPVAKSFDPSLTNIAVRIGKSLENYPAATDNNLWSAYSTSVVSYADVSNGVKSYDASTGEASVTSSVSISNRSDDTIEVNEWGIFTRVAYTGTGTSTSNTSDVLLYRARLDTPVTLRPQDTITITFTRKVRLNLLSGT